MGIVVIPRIAVGLFNRIGDLLFMKLFFDVETTGFTHNRIVQLAAILWSGRELASMSVLIEPDGWEIEPGAQEVHGISMEDCYRHGVPIESALWLFSELCEKAHIRVAHNSDFDERVTGGEFARLGREIPDNEKYCTMKACVPHCKIPPTPAMIRSGRRHFKSPSLAEAYLWATGEELLGGHDALVDCRGAIRVYERLLKENEK